MRFLVLSLPLANPKTTLLATPKSDSSVSLFLLPYSVEYSSKRCADSLRPPTCGAYWTNIVSGNDIFLLNTFVPLLKGVALWELMKMLLLDDLWQIWSWMISPKMLFTLYVKKSSRMIFVWKLLSYIVVV